MAQKRDEILSHLLLDLLTLSPIQIKNSSLVSFTRLAFLCLLLLHSSTNIIADYEMEGTQTLNQWQCLRQWLES